MKSQIITKKGTGNSRDSAPMGLCGICGSSRLTPLFEARDRNFESTPEVFNVCVCDDCGIVQTLPRIALENLGAYYPSGYYPISQESEDYYNKNIRPYQQSKLKIITPFIRGGRLLDIGCGAGFFLHEAARIGFVVDGIEFSEDAASYGRRKFGLSIHAGNVYDLNWGSQQYDVITLWHVLEHLHEPAKMIEMAMSHLSDSGILVVAVPNINSIQARLFRGAWYHLEVPRHLFHFSPTTLSALFDRLGLQVRGITFDSAEHNWAGILGSVIRLNMTDERIWHKALRKTIGFHGAKVLAWLESRMFQGGTFTVCASKKRR